MPGDNDREEQAGGKETIFIVTFKSPFSMEGSFRASIGRAAKSRRNTRNANVSAFTRMNQQTGGEEEVKVQGEQSGARDRLA